MQLKIFHIGPLDNCVYLIADSDEAIVIDPAHESTLIVTKEAEKIGTTIRFILNTHGHWDHIADNQTSCLLKSIPQFLPTTSGKAARLLSVH